MSPHDNRKLVAYSAFEIAENRNNTFTPFYNFYYSACTTSNCTPAAGEIDPELLKDFKRSLTWDISVPEKTVLSLEFAGGLKELSGSDGCQDGHQYSVSTTKENGEMKTKTYCKGGTVSHLKQPGATTVTAEVPQGQESEPAAFTVTAAPRGKHLLPLLYLLILIC